MGHRVFKARKKVREVSNEEESIEIWRRRKIRKIVTLIRTKVEIKYLKNKRNQIWRSPE